MKDDNKTFSIIDAGFVVEGSVTGKGRLVIKGKVKGTIQGDSVVIAEEGSVHADVHVTTMTIGGTFEGQLEAEKELVVLASGTCSGRISCKDLVVEAGGLLNATVSCKGGTKV